MIEVKEITKFYGELKAVNNISFRADQGQIFGLLGPNGAGKTTTLRMIVSILTPDEGEIFIEGTYPDNTTLDRMGYLPEERGLYLEQNVFDVLVYLASLKNIPKARSRIDIVRMLDRLSLVELADQKLYTLSRGNQQKVQIIAAIIHDPDFIILDEPFTGLDPLNQTVIRELIVDLKAAGKTIILSSHRMELVESLCDYICLLNKGGIILEGPLEEIKKREGEGTIVIEARGDLTFLSARTDIIEMEYTKNGAILQVARKFDMNQLVSELSTHAKIDKIERKTPTLRDLYLTAIKKHSVTN